MDNYAVIGDVHGCAKTLQNLLNKLPQIYEIYSVGDLIDRGTDTKETIEIAKKYNIKSCLGNHEWLFLSGYKKKMENHDSWISNGGKATFKQFKSAKELEKLAEYIRLFPLYYEKENTIICHAGIHPGLTLKEASDYTWSDNDEELLKSIVWNREPSKVKNSYIISGHTPKKKVIKTKYYCNIDTGCVFKNKLTAIIMPEKKFIQVPFEG